MREIAQSEVVEIYDGAPVSWYFDPLPTNCVADWVCPLSNKNKERDFRIRDKNLAVFYGSCSSDCLFCQNSSYRRMMATGEPRMTAEEVANAADGNTKCICFFGGDPSCNMGHSVETARILMSKSDITVCYETNGNISSKWLSEAAELVRESGGTIKFDLKAKTPSLYKALTGISNSTILNNFKKLADFGKRFDSVFLIASILLIPGYIGMEEVKEISGFIAKNDPTIPAALLGFMPHLHMKDLPRTSRAHAENALKTAKQAGLKNVRIGNRGLLSTAPYDYF